MFNILRKNFYVIFLATLNNLLTLNSLLFMKNEIPLDLFPINIFILCTNSFTII